MATWDDVVKLVQIMGGSAVSDKVLMLQLNGNGPSRKQQLFVALEVDEKLSLKLVQVQSQLGDIDSQTPGRLSFFYL